MNGSFLFINKEKKLQLMKVGGVSLFLDLVPSHVRLAGDRFPKRGTPLQLA